MSQHPHFELFKSAWKAADPAGALVHIDAVIADHPGVASLHWYRANCLEKLERYPEAAAAIDRVLALNPDHAAALVKQVELEWGNDAIDGDEEPTPAQRATLERKAAERQQRHTAQLRRAVAIDPTLADAWFGLWQLLRVEGGDEGPSEEVDAMLDRAVGLAPDRIEFRHARAELRRLQAMQVKDGTPEEACVTVFSGMRYLRMELEVALRDFEHCALLDGTYRYHVSTGRVLHDLGRFDEALARYDQALQRLAPDAPERPFIEDLRARSENNGGGERDSVAKLLEGLVAQGDRNQDDDNAAHALLGAARAVRSGQSVEAALSARLPESPDDLMAANIATQILNTAYEDRPQLVPADAKTFPAYQRAYAARQRKALEACGVHHVADAEAAGMTRTLGQRVLLGLHADDSGAVSVATFALRPKWPGYVAFVVRFVTGKWKLHRLTECITHFDDGGYFITQYENISPFDYGDVVRVERLPRRTPVAALVERHRQRIAEYRQANPHAQALPATDLANVEANWRRGQDIKRAYRQSIGYISEAELRRMLGGHYDRFAARVRQKLAELAPDYERSGALDG